MSLLLHVSRMLWQERWAAQRFMCSGLASDRSAFDGLIAKNSAPPPTKGSKYVWKLLGTSGSRPLNMARLPPGHFSSGVVLISDALSTILADTTAALFH